MTTVSARSDSPRSTAISDRGPTFLFIDAQRCDVEVGRTNAGSSQGVYNPAVTAKKRDDRSGGERRIFFVDDDADLRHVLPVDGKYDFLVIDHKFGDVDANSKKGDDWLKTVELVRGYPTGRERELQQEIVSLRTELEARRKALEDEKQGAEGEKAATARLRETLAELRTKETLSYILTRIHADAVPAVMGSPDLQTLFQDEAAKPAFVMSVDIRRSTDLMLKARTPQLYAAFITGVCNILKEIVLAHHGVFDKFTGDGILAFFPLFYTGDDAGLRAINAAADCHTAFAAHYERHRSTFIAVAKKVGLGIGIDYGDAHFVRVADGLTVVGTPVVYACRLGGAAAGTTMLNQPAYEMLSSRYQQHCDFTETEFEIKHEGPVVAYSVRPNGHRFDFPPAAWKSFTSTS
jgi:class 3 adenylate cyclase